MQDSAGFERRIRGQIHDKLHAHCPIAHMMTVGQAELRIELLADGADWAVTDDGECRVDVHPRQEAVARLALFIDPLVKQAYADDFTRGRARYSVRAASIFIPHRRARSDAPYLF